MAARIQRGCVLIARPILRSGLWTMSPVDRVVAITSVVLANHEPAKWFDGRAQVQIGRGQFVRSWGRLAREAKVSVRQARVSVGHLAASGFLSRRMIGRCSLYTLPKYQIYQDRRRYGAAGDIPEGYVLLARKMMESGLWALPPGNRILALTCLLLARHSPAAEELPDAEGGVSVGRGQFSTTWERLAAAANLGPDEARASMARLESSEFVVRHEAGGLLVLTVPNYDLYQSLSNYVDGPRDAVEGALSASVAVPEAPAPPLDGDKTVTRGGQDGDRTVTARGQDGDNKQEGKRNEKKGEGEDAPPSPGLFPPEAWGASPPLPPEALIAKAYQIRFPDVMGWKKALQQASLYLARGGAPDAALRAIAEETRQRVVIWRILDPIASGSTSCLANWDPPEERQEGLERTGMA